MEISELVRDILQEHWMDETIVDYICTILKAGEVEDIIEGIPPLLENSGLESEEAKFLCFQMMMKSGIISHATEEEVQNKLMPRVLNHEINISSQNPENKDPNRVYKFGNTYEVVNLGAVDVQKEEAKAASCPISFHSFLELTRDENPKVRKQALRELCPCQVKRDCEEFWKRIMEMNTDPDPAVRYQVLHNLCDGSPKDREDDIIKTIEAMHNDEDKCIRRRVHQVLASYWRRGKWNIM